MPEAPWPLRTDDLTFREAVEADLEALLSFRNDPAVNHFMVRTHVDPDELRRDWLAVTPARPTSPASSSATRRSWRWGSSTSSTAPAIRTRRPAPTA